MRHGREPRNVRERRGRRGAPGTGRPLRDVLVDHPRILFVGINPGLRSAAVGHHFAGPGNPFWRLLHAAGIVPEPITYERDRDLARYGLALTNLCPRATRSAAELTPDEMRRGCRTLARKVRRLRPAVVAFVGLTVYQRCVRAPAAGGAGQKLQPFGGARAFVLPNPSGLNASFPGFEHKLVWFRRLAAFARDVSHPSALAAAVTSSSRRRKARVRGASQSVVTGPAATNSKSAPRRRFSASRSASLQRGSGAPVSSQLGPLSARNMP